MKYKYLLTLLILPFVFGIYLSLFTIDFDYEKVNIYGNVKNIYKESILIKSIENSALYDKASVTIDNKSMIIVSTNGKLTKGTFDDLNEGDIVYVIFSGPVAESYPIQAYAKKILIVR